MAQARAETQCVIPCNAGLLLSIASIARSQKGADLCADAGLDTGLHCGRAANIDERGGLHPPSTEIAVFGAGTWT